MNERIKELVGQAKFMAEETVNKQISKNAELDAFAEKFAELIVKECVGLCNQWPDTVRQVMSQQIKEHFGVEE